MNKLKFEDLNISMEIKKAVKDMGFEEASPIQSQAIPLLLEGKDVCGQAQTGTGKTCAFGIPILEKIDPKDRSLQALVLCPTRELAIQVAEEIKRLSKYKRGIQILPVYGGQPIDRQLKALRLGVQLVIGTPGRVMDHMERGTIKLDKVKFVVLDEADEMLDMGFIEDIEKILRKMPKERQTMFFSATMPKAFLGLTSKFQKNPLMIKVVHEQLTVPKVEQYFYEVKEAGKVEALTRLLDFHEIGIALVFCNTKRAVDELTEHLQARGYSADGLHGDLKQTQRDRVMGKFRRGAVDILVATDVAARGLDIDNIEVVFNYDLPQDEEAYVHRIGRTARAGKSGKAFTFVAGKGEFYKLRDIQKYSKAKIHQQKLPSLDDVGAIRKNQLVDRIKETIKEKDILSYVNTVESMILNEEFGSLEVAAALLMMMTGTEVKQDEYDKDDLENTGAAPGMVRMFMSIGKAQNVTPRELIDAIAKEARIDNRQITKLFMHDKFTFFEVPLDKAKFVLTNMKDKQIKGNRAYVAPALRRG